MAAAAYWTGDPIWLARKFLIGPYSLATWINSRAWSRGKVKRDHLRDEVWIGRAPSRRDRRGMNSVVALTAELPVRSDAYIPMVDLIAPTHEQLDAAVRAIDELAGQRPTLVCCALGYSRSAITVAAWLIASGYATDAEDAFAQVARARPQVRVNRNLRLRLQQWVDRRNGNSL
jgi:hypothetical protein